MKNNKYRKKKQNFYLSGFHYIFYLIHVIVLTIIVIIMHSLTQFQTTIFRGLQSNQETKIYLYISTHDINK